MYDFLSILFSFLLISIFFLSFFFFFMACLFVLNLLFGDFALAMERKAGGLFLKDSDDSSRDSDDSSQFRVNLRYSHLPLLCG